jgi:hypothetical protein
VVCIKLVCHLSLLWQVIDGIMWNWNDKPTPAPTPPSITASAQPELDRFRPSQ